MELLRCSAKISVTINGRRLRPGDGLLRSRVLLLRGTSPLPIPLSSAPREPRPSSNGGPAAVQWPWSQWSGMRRNGSGSDLNDRSSLGFNRITKNNRFDISYKFTSFRRNNFTRIIPRFCNLLNLSRTNCGLLQNLGSDFDCSLTKVGDDRRLLLRPFCTKQSKVNLAENEKDLHKSTDATKSPVKDLQYATIWTVPNLLTMLRMVLTPVLGYLVLQEAYSPACGVFVVAGLTDMLDGFIARNFQNQTSALGSFIDPLADKLLISVLFVSLTAVNLLPVALTALVVTRDICLTSAGFYVRYISLNPRPKSLREFFDITNPSAKLQPTLISKVNTAVQLSVVAFTLAAPVFDFVEHPALQALWYFTAVTTVLSGVGYIFAKDTFRLLQQTRKNN